MSRSHNGGDRPLGGNGPLGDELVAVEEAARARLRAATDGDGSAAAVAAEALVAAATSAMVAGCTLSDIAQAELRGKAHLREELHDDALKLVERSGRQMRQAELDHHQAIARAVRLGLSMREIAVAAGVTHGTIRAISNRLVGGDAGDRLVANEAQASPAEMEAGRHGQPQDSPAEMDSGGRRSPFSHKGARGSSDQG